MCSCDYFELTNYRCPGGEKDEFDQTTRTRGNKFVFSNETAIEFAVNHFLFALRAKKFAGGDDQPNPCEEISTLASLQ